MAVIMPRSAYIHVPKTGGTWCRAAIKAAGIKHFESGPNVKRKLSRTHAKFSTAYPTICIRDWRNGDDRPVKRFTFGFVRNPMAWLESRWADAIRKYGGVANHDIGNWFKASFSHDFKQYVDNVIRIKANAPSMAMLGRLGYHQDGARWVTDAVKMDFVGRAETLIEDFIKALELAGEKFNDAAIRKTAPRRVASKLKEFKSRISWTKEQRQAILDANADLCRIFGYDH